MNETKLEQLAIEELLREAETHSMSTSKLKSKRNKLGKPNKQFLSNTLTAAMTYNKREQERTQKNCREKLQKLEDRRTARMRKPDKYQKHTTGTSQAYSASSSDTEPDTITPDDSKFSCKRLSGQHTNQSAKRRRIHPVKKTKISHTLRTQYEQEEYYAKYFAELAAFALASESYNQVGKWLCYQALLAGSCESYEQNYEEPYEYMTHHGIEVLEPLNPIKENTISLSSGDEIKEELNLDDDSNLETPESPIPKFETVQFVENCISLDSDEEEQNDSNSLSPGLLKEELNSLDGAAIQTIELSDSSDDEEGAETCRDVNGAIDSTSD